MPTRSAMPSPGPAVRPSRPSPPSHRLATTVWTLAVPLALLVVAVLVVLSWRDDLPHPVASHWGAAGPDGSSSLGGTLAVLVVTVVAFSLVAWLVGLLMGRTSVVRRTAAFLGMWFATFLGTLVVGSLAVQRGLADWRQAPDLGLVPLVAVAAGLVLGVLAAVLTPGDAPLPATARVPADAPRARLAGTAGASWTGIVAFTRPWLAAAIGVAIVAAVALLTRSAALAVPIAAVLGLVGLTLGPWTVTVDERGLTARTVLPRPRTVVPLAEVESAEVVQVDPIRDFGGWGYRLGRAGRAGIVLRPGEAILVHRSGGRELVVTVDDAHRGAALLNTLAERTRR
ncbi:MAG TPA: DUF1648 domain-containing protein [Cellulomonas sp.]